MEQKFYQENRRRFVKLMPEDTVAVFFSGEEHRRTNDVFYEFEPDKNFLYLTGIDREKMALLVLKRNGSVTEKLFMPAIEEEREKWYGVQLRPAQAAQISGITAMEDIKLLESFLFSLFASNGAPAKLMLPFGLAIPGEAPDQGRKLSANITAAFPSVDVVSAMGLMTSLRYCKQPQEITLIREAVALLGQGLQKVRELVAPGRYEYEIRAAYEGLIASNGGRCYGTVCAAGQNAVCLHHSRQTGMLQQDELFLIDVGAPKEYYWADVSRTYPVSGRFTQHQAEIYSIVLEAQQLAIEAVRPGVAEAELNEIIKKHYAKELSRLGLIDQPQEVDRYYYHNVGHPIGLDVHDLRPEPRILAENAVYTIEPGLYIAQWGMGIRIEDDVLITPHGCEILTSAIPKAMHQVEM
ncbi:MAG: Xaa-Pro aminopeptidase [Angelakisella sp.]|nr:Xaa-Pro aminopeptidase [Angelakisella sp.]